MSNYMLLPLDYCNMLASHAHCIAVGVARALSHVCLFVCLFVCLRSKRKMA